MSPGAATPGLVCCLIFFPKKHYMDVLGLVGNAVTRVSTYCILQTDHRHPDQNADLKQVLEKPDLLQAILCLKMKSKERRFDLLLRRSINTSRPSYSSSSLSY